VWFRTFNRRHLHRIAARTRRFVVRRILSADDPPARLALGVAIGLFVTFTPTIGVQSVLVVALAWMLGANKLVGLPLVWLSNPATFVPIYYPCYRIGRWLLGGPQKGAAWWRELTRPPEGYVEATQFYWSRLMEIIVPLSVGSLLVAFPVAVVGYIVTYQGICRYRLQRYGSLVPTPRIRATPPQPRSK
jgi:uncharacterized protein